MSYLANVNRSGPDGNIRLYLPGRLGLTFNTIVLLDVTPRLEIGFAV